MGYQLVVTHRPGTDTVGFAAQVDTGEPHGWVTVDEWSCPAPARLTAKSRSALVEEQLAAHGWSPVDLPVRGAADGVSLIPVEPVDWRAVLTVATENRARRLAAYDAADFAWKTLVAATPRRGEKGYVATMDIAKLAGLTRHRVYQLQGVGSHPGFTPTGTS